MRLTLALVLKVSTTKNAFLTLFAACLLLMSVTSSAKAAIYWSTNSGIGRANLDGSNADPNFISGQLHDFSACSLAVDGSHIYWGNALKDAIGRANLDGTEANGTFITGIEEPCGLAVNDNHLFWVKTRGESIGRVNLDGSQLNGTFISGLSHLCGIAVNDEHIFWSRTNSSENSIGRATLDGNVIESETLENVGDGPCGIATTESHIYWGTFSDEIGRASLDGSILEPQLITGLEIPCGVAADSSRLLWSEQFNFSGLGLGIANLDGTEVRRGLVEGIHRHCAIAVDSLYASALPPPPYPVSRCAVVAIKPNKWRGTALVLLDAQAHSRISIKTPGLRWRILTNASTTRGHLRWALKVWPGGKGLAGRRIRQRLKRTGRASLKLRIRCGVTFESFLPASTVESLTLRRKERGVGRGA